MPEQSKRGRRRAERGLPMAPALAAAGNATTLVGTAAYASGGVAGVATAGALAAAGATAAVVRRRKSVRRNMAARSGAQSGGGGQRSGGATAGWGSLGSLSGGGRSVAPRRGGGGSGGTGSASGPSHRSGGGLLGPSGGASGARSGKGAPGGLGSGGGRHAPGGGSPKLSKVHNGGVSKSPTLRAAVGRTMRAAAAPGSTPRKTLAAVGHGAAAVGRGTLGPSVRAAKATGRGIKKAWTADRSKQGRHTLAARAKHLGGAAGDGIRSILAASWAGLRKRSGRAALARLRDTWTRRRKQRADKNTPAPVTPVVAAGVRRPTTTATAPTTTTGAGTMPGHHFVAPAMEMARIAAAYSPTGMLQVGEDFAGLEEALRLTAEAMKITVERADAEDPLAPQIIEIMRQIYGLQLKAAELATELKPAFESLHQVDLDRLRNPRKGAAGERKWDVTTNLGTTY